MAWALWATGALAIAGTLVLTLCTIAIVREPDVNVKIHATSLAAMLGLPLVLGASVFTGDLDLILRAALVGLFSGLTSPIGTHELARLQLRQGSSESPADRDGQGVAD